MTISRRVLVQGVAIGAASRLAFVGSAAAQEAAPEPGKAAPEPAAFGFEEVVAKARQLASVAYEEPQEALPEPFQKLSYDQYRAIWFKPEAAIWADKPTPFRLDLFHPGFVYHEAVDIYLVDNGKAQKIPFSTDLFEYGYLDKRPTVEGPIGFAGFRARYPINSPEAYQEFLVFQGASYFRAVARNQVYGLSARGLAIDTAEASGEEFPTFRAFWIEQPEQGSGTLVVNALLDSRSATGAYRFAVTPGAETVTEVKAELFFRREVKKIGIAPLTSMFLYNEMNRKGFDDYRRAVHDSNGLQMLTGTGEWLWRPLANPAELQISSFADLQPRAFGLMQRSRNYDDFLDPEAKYERRPGLWVEPKGDWGKGVLELVEIPTDNEYNDNIVAYWRPETAPAENSHMAFSYRMRWTSDVLPSPDLLYVAGSYSGKTPERETILFIVDFARAGDNAEIDRKSLRIDVTASSGEVSNAIVHESHPKGAIRVSFELDPAGADLAELRLSLARDAAPASETWLYRWTKA